MKEHRLLIFLLIGVTFVQLAFAGAINLWFHDWTKSGVFGDTFGAINSLFSALAFAGLIYTIILQSRELKLQRDELSLTREQIADSAKSQRDQAAYALLTAQINAAVSKQEIYANHYLNQKQFPGHEGFGLESMRKHLKSLLDETDRLILEAENKISV